MPLIEATLHDGAVLIGRLIADEVSGIRIVTSDGTEIAIARDRIASLAPFSGRMVEHELWRDDALESKLFLSATGRSLRRGEAYVAIYGVFAVPVVHVGITDRVSIGVGKPWYVFSPDLWITPTVQVHRGARSSAAVGLLHFHAPRAGHVQVGFGAATITENYLYGSGAVLSFGVRLVGRRTFYVETGGVMPIVSGLPPLPGPFISFAWAAR